MHVGDRHPKQSFEAVRIGLRTYQVNSMGAVRAGLKQAEAELGPSIDVNELPPDDEDGRTAGTLHNTEVLARAWEIAGGAA